MTAHTNNACKTVIRNSGGGESIYGFRAGEQSNMKTCVSLG